MVLRMNSNLFQKLLMKSGPIKSFTEAGISKQERRRRALIHAATAPQQPRPINDLPDRRIIRNEWAKNIYGGLAFSPEVWKRGRLE